MQNSALKLELAVKADSRYKFDRKQVRAGVLKILAEHKINQKVVLSLLIVGERKIRELEKTYFKVDQITDVLSFPQSEGEIIPGEENTLTLGDVVVCYPQAKRQALRFNKLLDDEIEFLVCHGVLHLLGIHHD